MTIGDHLEEFGGLPAYTFPDATTDESKEVVLPSAESVAWRLSAESYDAKETWGECFTRFLYAVDTAKVTAIIVGTWQDVYDNGPTEVIEGLRAAADRLPALRALFLGDIVMEECEISWINQGLVTPILEIFPDLEVLGVRGGQGLEFDAVRHEKLRTLTVETGGLPAEVVRGIAASDFPALTHLDLWLGTSEYGGDSEVEDLAGILSGARLPALEHLALRNSENQDAVCAALASAPVVARLKSLDVSMGVLTDEGAAALLSGQPLGHLDSLDLHYNYLSDAMRAKFREVLEPAGVRLDLDSDDAEEDSDDEDGTVWRFVSVGE
ncbi:STM4015 family protein [Nocardia bovistercoris]|uniref:STM4015 family protein n=1 Tax=Nocardia bovistercoris TaxID=2785916 RepID=A0A931N1U1_9NOCA|nr:STM4015 family protein [Nocardia bovistercoris]MBH0776047.1 STM4015 family protein [Nocardia bovistercoris]